MNYAPERTGIAPYTARMAERLAADGHDVRVLTTFPHYPEWRFTTGELLRSSHESEGGVLVERRRHRLPRIGSSTSRVRSELSFGWRALTSTWNRPDVVILVSPALFASVLLVPRILLHRVPFVVWVQDLYGPGVRETGAGDRLGVVAAAVGRLEGWLLGRAAAVVAIHEQMAAAIMDLGVEPGRVSVVRNWTHLARPQVDIDRTEARAEFGWTQDETIVLHTGNMGLKQDLGNVVEAARLAERTGARMRFVLVGDGADRPSLESASRGLHDVQMLPPAPPEQYPRLLEAADVLLVNEHPGVRNMALPSKLTSYFSSGRPVLAATSEDSATASELRRSNAGERVDPGRPAELVRAVERLVADPARMEELARAGWEYRRTTLSEEGAGRAFERIVLQAARTQKPGRFSAPASP